MNKKTLIVLFILLMGTNMVAATETLDPASDGATQEWTKNGTADTHWESVLDDERQPDAPGTSNYIDTNPFNSYVDMIGIEDGTFTTITEAVVWSYVDCPNYGFDVSISFDEGSTWEADESIPRYCSGWESDTFSGLSEIDPTQIQVRYTANGNAGPKDVYQTYVVLTGSAGANSNPDVNYNTPNVGYYNSPLTVDWNISDIDPGEDLNFTLCRSSSAGACTTKILDNWDVNVGICDDADFTDSTNCTIAIDTTPIPDGNYFIDVNGHDNSLAGGIDSSTVKIMIDNVQSTNSWDGNHGKPWETNDQNIHLACDDNGSGCSLLLGNIEYRIDTDATTTVTYSAWLDYNSGIEISADGNWAFEFRSTDRAGNTSDINGQYHVLIDKNLPSGTLHIKAKLILDGDFTIAQNATTLADEWSVRSFRDIKEDIEDVNKTLLSNYFRELKFYTYTFEDENKMRIGLLSDEVPYFLTDDTNGINLYALISTMGATIQLQEERIAALEQQQAIVNSLLDWITNEISKLWIEVNKLLRV